MFEMFNVVLAQDSPPAGPPVQSPTGEAGTVDSSPANGAVDSADGGGGGGSGFDMIWLLLLILVVMWVFLLSGQRKEKKKRKELLSALKKNDRVETVGGILGTVVEVRDDEVVVKVDENANTRLRFSRGAIKTIIEDKEKI